MEIVAFYQYTFFVCLDLFGLLEQEFPEGTTSLACGAFSDDGALFAYGLSIGGSDWITIKVRDVQTGKDLDDRINWVKFSSIEWLHDNSGFFYGKVCCCDFYFKFGPLPILRDAACFPAPEGVTAGLDADKDGEKTAGTETGSNTNHMIYFHRIGTNADEDKRVYSDSENPNWVVGMDVTDDGNFLLVCPSNGCDPVNRLYFGEWLIRSS